MTRRPDRLADRLRPLAAGVLTLLVALGTGACALGGRTGISTFADGEPLDVWIESPGNTIGSPFPFFHLNQPAYVAVFDLRPGVGVSTVYPHIDTAEPRLFHAGYNTVLPSAGASLAAHEGFSCSALASPVVYRLIVASRTPLRLSNLRGRVGFAFRPALNRLQFAIGSPGRIMREIAGTIVSGRGGAVPAAELGGVEWSGYYTAFWSPTRCDVPRLAHGPRFRLGDVTHDDRPDEDAGRDGERPTDDGEETADDAPEPRPPVVDDLLDDALRDGDRVLRPERPGPERGEAASGATPREAAIDVRARPDPRTSGLRDRVISGELRGRLGPPTVEGGRSIGAGGRRDAFDASPPRIRHRPLFPSSVRDPAWRAGSRGPVRERSGARGMRRDDRGLDRVRVRPVPSSPARTRSPASDARVERPSKPE